MIRIQQSHAQTNPCKAVFYLATQVYPSEDVIPVAILERWWQQHPTMFHLAFDDEQLCGYISAFPLSENGFEQTLKPDFDEKSLEPSSILDFDKQGIYQMYFCSIVVHPDWQGKTVSKQLRHTFLSYLFQLWHSKKCVTQLSASVVSAKGKQMMASLGLEHFKTGLHGNIFYGQHSSSSLETCLKQF